jgi:Mg-chelatase subunit ChlD
MTFTLAHPTVLTFSEVNDTVEVPMTLEKDIAGQIVLAIDVSASMGIADVQPSRLEAAKATLIEFVENASDTVRFGVVAFGGWINKSLPITQDNDAVVEIIRSLSQVEALPCLEEYTDIGNGLQVAVDLLKPYGSSNRSSGIILVSDGFANYGFPNPFNSIAKGIARANEIGVPIHTLHVASLGQDSNDELMRQIALQAHGKFMSSSSLSHLEDVLTVMGKFYTPTYEWSSEVEIKTTIPSRTELGFILMFVAAAFILALWIGNYRHYKTSF